MSHVLLISIDEKYFQAVGGGKRTKEYQNIENYRCRKLTLETLKKLASQTAATSFLRPTCCQT